VIRGGFVGQLHGFRVIAERLASGLDVGNLPPALGLAESFKECAADPCREVLIEDPSVEPFTGWDLKSDKARWSSL
jgi:hypothetical protein